MAEEYPAEITDPDKRPVFEIPHTVSMLLVEPADAQTSCRACFRTYKTGTWRLYVAETNDLHICRQCVEDISKALPLFPDTKAPYVLY
jgi:hypothetical protein